MPLTELKIKNLKPRKSRYLVSDGHGLSIAVMPTGEKYWWLRSWENGKERKVSLGRYPDVGLKQARELRYAPAAPKAPAAVPLSQVAEDWYQTRCVPVDAPHTLAAKRSRLDRFILPALGGLDITQIKPQALLALLRKIQEDRGPTTGARARMILSQIFQYAIAAGLCEWNPAQQLAGALIPLPPPRHLSVIRTEDEARAVLRAVGGYERNPIARLGLLLLAHTFVRPGELRLAQWPEVDFDAAEWKIPAARMKMRVEHVVPLSTQACALFSELRALTRRPVWCFALPLSAKPIGKTFLSNALRRLGYGQGKMTPHGFRGMASTLLNENGFPPDVIERQLAHTERNAVRAAYNRAEHLDERRRMMQWWGDYLDGLRGIKKKIGGPKPASA